jgi:hypothetical protein
LFAAVQKIPLKNIGFRGAMPVRATKMAGHFIDKSFFVNGGVGRWRE